MRLAEEDRYQNCGLDFISLRSIDQLYANRFGWRFLLSPLAPRLTFFTHRSFQGSALERPVPLALPSTPSASRLTFSTRNVSNAASKWIRSRSYQASGSGTVRPELWRAQLRRLSLSPFAPRKKRYHERSYPQEAGTNEQIHLVKSFPLVSKSNLLLENRSDELRLSVLDINVCRSRD